MWRYPQGCLWDTAHQGVTTTERGANPYPDGNLGNDPPLPNEISTWQELSEPIARRHFNHHRVAQSWDPEWLRNPDTPNCIGRLPLAEDVHIDG